MTLSLASSITTGVAPAKVTLTATIAGAANGNVSFKDGTLAIGNAAIDKSAAVLTTTLNAGIHRLSAAYQGSGAEIDSLPVNVVVDNARSCP